MRFLSLFAAAFAAANVGACAHLGLFSSNNSDERGLGAPAAALDAYERGEIGADAFSPAVFAELVEATDAAHAAAEDAVVRRAALRDKMRLVSLAADLGASEDVEAWIAEVRTDAAADAARDVVFMADVAEAETLAAGQEYGEADARRASLRADVDARDCAEDVRTWCARAHIVAASFDLSLGDRESALGSYSVAEELLDAERVEERSLVALMLAGRSLIATQSGDPNAVDLWVEAAELYSQGRPGQFAVIFYTNVASVLLRAGRLDDAETWARNAVSICETAPAWSACDRNRADLMLAYTYFENEQTYKSMALLGRVYRRQLAAGEGDAIATLNTRTNLANALSVAGHFREAVAVSTPDFDRLAASPHEVERTMLAGLTISHVQASLQMLPGGRASTPAEGVADPLDYATRLLDYDVPPIRRAYTQQVRAEVLSARGEHDAALAAARDALALDKTSQRNKLSGQVTMAAADIARGRKTRGYAAIDAAIAEASTPRLSRALSERAANIAAEAEDWDRVESYARAALRFDEPTHLLTISSQVLPKRQRARRETAALLIEAIGARGGPNADIDAFAASQDFFAASGGEALRLALGAAGFAEVEAVRGDIEALLARRTEILKDGLARAGREKAPLVALDEIGLQLAEIDNEILARESAIVEAAPDLAVLRAAAQTDPADVGAALASNEAFLQVVSARDKLQMFLIKPSGGLVWRSVDAQHAELCALVDRTRAYLDPSGRRVCPNLIAPSADETLSIAARAFDAEAAHALHELIIAPFDADLDGVSKLIIAADGPVASLPMGVLLTTAADPGDVADARFQNYPWLARRFALAIAPDAGSVSSAFAPASPAYANERPRLFAAGAPCVGYERIVGCPDRDDVDSAPVFRGGAAIDVEALDPLPGSARELRTLARDWRGPADVLIGRKATEGAFRNAEFERYQRAILSTHVFTAGEHGLSEPGLVFSLADETAAGTANDGYLSASEIAADLSFDLDLLVVAGCSSIAPATGFENAPLTGLARAFFAAGARTLVMTHTPLRDDRSLDYTRALLFADGDYAAALQQVILSKIDAEADPADADPRAWASFVVVGR